MGRTPNEQRRAISWWHSVFLSVGLLGWLISGSGVLQGQESSSPLDRSDPKLEPVAESSPATQNGRGWLPTGVRDVRDSVLRIDIFEDDIPRGHGTGFVVAVNEDHALLVTCAHVVNQKAMPSGSIKLASNADKKRIHFKATHPKSGLAFDVIGGVFHPDYPRTFFYEPQACQTDSLSGMTNDVAVLKIQKTSGDQFPAAFELAPDENLDELQGAPVHLWGFPGVSLVESTKPYYSHGTVSLTDDRSRWLMYDTTAAYGASGSPVFVVQPRVQVIGVHFSGTCDVAGRPKNLGYAVNIRQTREILKKAENSEFDFANGYLVDPPDPPEAPIELVVGGSSGDDPESTWRTFDEVFHLARLGQLELALERLLDLITKMEGKGRVIPIAFQLLRARLTTDVGKTFVEGRLPNGDSSNTTRTARVQLGEDHLLGAANSLRSLVETNGDDIGLNLLYIRAEVEYARTRKSKPIDVKRLEWAHGRVNELLKRPRLANEDIARGLFLRGLIHFYLPSSRQHAHQDFANSFSKSPSRQSEEWMLFMDGYVNMTSKKPDLWESLYEVQTVEVRYRPLESVPQRKKSR